MTIDIEEALNTEDDDDNANRGKKGVVLVVDDNPVNLRVLFNYLQAKGFKTLVATSGERVLRQLEHLEPDLILMDVMMPGIDGFETCRRLKANEETQSIPIIFMTALSDLESKVEGFRVGAVDYVTKPFQYEEVLARVNTHITIRKLQKLLEERNEKLQNALTKVELLSGLLPICANCKKIRDDEGYWQEVEVYVEEHSEAQFSHGICPNCMSDLYPEFFGNKK